MMILPFVVISQTNGAYTVTEQQAIDQERDTTNCEYYGDGGNGTGGAYDYSGGGGGGGCGSGVGGNGGSGIVIIAY